MVYTYTYRHIHILSIYTIPWFYNSKIVRTAKDLGKKTTVSSRNRIFLAWSNRMVSTHGNFNSGVPWLNEWWGPPQGPFTETCYAAEVRRSKRHSQQCQKFGKQKLSTDFLRGCFFFGWGEIMFDLMGEIFCFQLGFGRWWQQNDLFLFLIIWFSIILQQDSPQRGVSIERVACSDVPCPGWCALGRPPGS